MNTNTLLLIVVPVVTALVIVGLLGVVIGRRQRTKKLQEKFGPEYDHIISERGDQREAEHELVERLDHVKALDIRPLSMAEFDRFTSQWRATQAEFVDEPLTAMQKADQLIRKVMETKGYPVEDFEQQVADISVDYPELVMDYRGLHLIAIKGSDENVSTEEMRQAMVHGRALFENLMKDHEATTIVKAEVKPEAATNVKAEVKDEEVKEKEET
jgi:bacterioferritin (cytochrome b1)